MKREPAVTASERYLRRATRGLWGRRRQEVREELAAHLQERVLAHRMGGLSETEALEQALTELGEPGQVQAGMLKLYTLPTVAGSGLALAAACALVALLPRGSAQALPGTPYFPTAECVNALTAGADGFLSGDCITTDNAMWLDRQALRQTLGPQGVTFKEITELGTDDGLLGITFPAATPVFIAVNSPDTYIMGGGAATTRLLRGYLSLWDLLRGASFQDDFELQVTGWDNPVVHFGDTRLQIGTESRPMIGLQFYENFLGEILFAELNPDSPLSTYLINPNRAAQDGSTLYRDAVGEKTVMVPEANGEVYGLVMRLGVDEVRPGLAGSTGYFAYDNAVVLDVVRADAQERLTFSLPNGPLRLATTLTDDSKPRTAVLVRMSGTDFDSGYFEIVQPENATIQ